MRAPEPAGLPQPICGNCLTWAWRMQRAYGGRLRLSPHPRMAGKVRALWSPFCAGEVWFAYLPVHPRRGLAAFFHAIRFRGRVVRHAAPERGWLELNLPAKGDRM